MTSLICPTCGCSLVRLGIRKAKSVAYSHDGQEYRFCCKGCADIFISDPKKYLDEANSLRVCPTCLGEKPLESTVKLAHGGRDLHFCRCPQCLEEFKKNPDYFLKRLEGGID